MAPARLTNQHSKSWVLTSIADLLLPYTSSLPCVLLLQLYFFLLVDDTLDQDYGGSMKRNKLPSLLAKQPPFVKCSCNFEELPSQNSTAGAGELSAESSQLASAPLHQPLQAAVQHGSGQQQDESAAAGIISGAAKAPSQAAPELPADMLRTIMEHATAEMRAKCAVSVGGEIGAAAQEVLQMEELQCFYSKHTVRDAGTVLCMPVSGKQHSLM